MGYLSDKKNYEHYQGQFHSVQNMLLKWLGQQNLDYGKSEALLKGLAPLLNKGFGEAKANLAGAGGAAKQSILKNQAQGSAKIAQQGASSGFFNSTVQANAQRGLTSDISRQLADVDEGVGSMLANLQVGKTQALAGAQGALASFYPQKSAAQLGSRFDYGNFVLGQMGQKPQFGNYLSQGLSKGLDIAALLGGMHLGGGMMGAGGSAYGGMHGMPWKPRP